MSRLADGGDNLRAALACAAAGWPVFPCRAGAKVPLTAHGFRDASTEPTVIRDWWARWPGANVAVATGAPGPDVLDIDVRAQGGELEGGWPSLNKLARAKLFSARRPWVATPSGGRHVYFEGTSQRCGSLPKLHLDFRAAGGYVLVPPSVVRGRAYQLRVRRPVTGSLDWQACRDLLDPRPQLPARPWPPGRTSLAALVRWVERQPHGNHNNGLFWAAMTAIDGGLDPWPLVPAAVKAGHDERRAVRTVASAIRRRRS